MHENTENFHAWIVHWEREVEGCILGFYCSLSGWMNDHLIIPSQTYDLVQVWHNFKKNAIYKQVIHFDGICEAFETFNLQLR